MSETPVTQRETAILTRSQRIASRIIGGLITTLFMLFFKRTFPLERFVAVAKYLDQQDVCTLYRECGE
jgi:hypothetical protein